MPSTYAERAARWPGMDTEAMLYLEGRGFKLSRDGKWEWSHSNPDYIMTARDIDAMLYLIEEWDFGYYTGNNNWAKQTFDEKDFEEAAIPSPGKPVV